jgi:hypothetical protein
MDAANRSVAAKIDVCMPSVDLALVSTILISAITVWQNKERGELPVRFVAMLSESFHKSISRKLHPPFYNNAVIITIISVVNQAEAS